MLLFRTAFPTTKESREVRGAFDLAPEEVGVFKMGGKGTEASCKGQLLAKGVGDAGSEGYRVVECGGGLRG